VVPPESGRIVFIFLIRKTLITQPTHTQVCPLVVRLDKTCLGVGWEF
jgi:hypothetical protein